MTFLFRGTLTQKRTGCFEERGYGANKLLFWIFPSGEVGCTEKCSVLVWFIFLLNTFGVELSFIVVEQLSERARVKVEQHLFTC